MLSLPLYKFVYGHNMSVESKEFLARYTCAICNKRFVVPDLARGCEEKHLQKEYNNAKV
jgi:transposase-like protein